MTCQHCNKPPRAKGLCQAHYRANLRTRHKNGEPIRPYTPPITRRWK